MPILGADMEDGTLVEWHKSVGERVSRGDIIAEVETEKGLTEVEVFVEGVLEKILVTPGTKVPVGTPLALIREEGGSVAAASPAGGAPVQPAEPLRAPQVGTPPVAPAGGPAPRHDTVAAATAAPRSSPAARRRAAELGVDLSRVRGTGPGGAVQIADVEQAAKEGAAAPPAPAHDRMRETIATVMTRAKREIPHYYLGTTIDLETTVRWLEQRNEPRPPAERLLPGAALIKAVALALREVPELNGTWTKDRFEPNAAIHVGVAISLRGGGLVAPALHDADRKSLDELMHDLLDLVGRARAGRVRSSELSDPTITVTNLGDQGVESVFPIVYPPQVAIVGFGRIVARPWVVGDAIVPRRVVTASLSADHRVTDGHRGARFLTAVDRLLQKPGEL